MKQKRARSVAALRRQEHMDFHHSDGEEDDHCGHDHNFFDDPDLKPVQKRNPEMYPDPKTMLDKS